MKIGNIDLGDRCALAPMAGVTDRAFREVCRLLGCGYVVSEMASCQGLLYKNEKTKNLLTISDGERPMAIQIFGYDPKIMAEGAKMVLRDFKPDILDINMGCPAPKITGNNSGSALMKNKELAGEIVYAVKNAALSLGSVPVTVKFRKAWNEESVFLSDGSYYAAEFAKTLEKNGADALTVHGRTREQMYSGKADLNAIKAVCDAVKIPVIANGDVDSVKAYLRMKEETNCDLVMIGRGAMGNPWIFKEINHFNETREILPPPSVDERLEVLKLHIKKLCEYKTERIGIKEARKHAAWYFRDMRGAAKLRKLACELTSYEDLLNLCEEAKKEQEE